MMMCCFLDIACTGDEHGWSRKGMEEYLWTDECSIDRIPIKSLDDRLFQAFYLERKPAIIVGSSNEVFQRLTNKAGFHALMNTFEPWLIQSYHRISREFVLVELNL